MDALQEKGIDLEELTLHVGAGTFKPVKSEEIEGHEMHTEYISVNRSTIKKLIDHDGCAIAVEMCIRDRDNYPYSKIGIQEDSFEP